MLLSLPMGVSVCVWESVDETIRTEPREAPPYKKKDKVKHVKQGNFDNK